MSAAGSVPRGRAAGELNDAELEQQGTQAHVSRNWVFLHGTAEQFAQHTQRMLELEQEYLRRYPQRTWQGSGAAPAADPVRAVLTAVADNDGRMHKLEVQQAARAAGLQRAVLATLYARGLLVTEAADRVLTDAGRAWLAGYGTATAGAATAVAPAELHWVLEEQPTWDEPRRRIVGGAPEGVFALNPTDGQALPGDWWSARDDAGSVLGYGWMDVTWGEAEVLLAVDGAAQRGGVGSWVLAQLEREAAARGLNYVYNTVRPTHPDRDVMHDWLGVRGYTGSGTDAALRKRVGVAPEPPGSYRDRSAGRDSAATSSGSDPAGADRGPGHEEQGGYVDVEDHQY